MLESPANRSGNWMQYFYAPLHVAIEFRLYLHPEISGGATHVAPHARLSGDRHVVVEGMIFSSGEIRLDRDLDGGLTTLSRPKPR